MWVPYQKAMAKTGKILNQYEFDPKKERIYLQLQLLYYEVMTPMRQDKAINRGTMSSDIPILS